jgi:hypothetical protein
MTKAASCRVAVALSQRWREPIDDTLFGSNLQTLSLSKNPGDASTATPDVKS